MFLVVLLYALFASVFTIAKTGLQYSPPFFFVGSRMFLAGLILLAYQFFFKREQFQMRREDWGRIFRLALFCIYLTNMFEFWGLKYLTSFKTCFIYSLSPFVAALFSYLMFSEKMGAKKWIGLLIGFMGFLPILLHETSTEEAAGNFFFFSWAEIAVMCAAVSGVYGWTLLRQLVKENGYSSIMANGMSMVIGGGLALIHSFIAEDWNPLPITQTLPFLECACALIVISNLICYNLYGFLLKRYTATFMSFAGFITPFFSAFFGWYYLHEAITWPFYLSATIVFCGLLIFYQEELRENYTLPVQAKNI